jgi:hypothetical protein
MGPFSFSRTTCLSDDLREMNRRTKSGSHMIYKDAEGKRAEVGLAN